MTNSYLGVSTRSPARQNGLYHGTPPNRQIHAHHGIPQAGRIPETLLQLGYPSRQEALREEPLVFYGRHSRRTGQNLGGFSGKTISKAFMINSRNHSNSSLRGAHDLTGLGNPETASPDVISSLKFSLISLR